MMKLVAILMLSAAAPVALAAQAVFIPVNAPYAQSLVIAVKNEHPELQKLGLHAIPPGRHHYAIIANGIPSKIGKESSPDDLAVLASRQPSVKRNEKGRFYDLCLPISDAEGTSIGITVMEIPFSQATDSADALAKAIAIRDEMQKKIASYSELFQAADAPLKLTQTIPTGADITGHFDHFGVDLKHHRVFLAAEDSHEVLVIDTVNDKVIHVISGLARPHAILYREDLNRIYVTDGGAGLLRIYDGKTYAPAGTVTLLKDADSIGYDASTKDLYIDNGGADLGEPYSLVSVVDTTTDRKIADIRVDSPTLEAMALDIWRPRMYVNNAAQNKVTVIDRWNDKIVASWPITLGTHNVAMGLDEQRQRLFVGCRSGNMVVFDTNTGTELQSLPITKGVDDIQFDAASRRVYAIGDGTIDIYQEVDADHYRLLGSVNAGAGAKTGRLVPEINRYFAAAPAANGVEASVHVLQPLNTPRVKERSKEAPPVAVYAPNALKLEMSTLSAHPDLRKMGLHAVPPGDKYSVIIVNGNTSRIGYRSSAGDLAAVAGGNVYCVKKADGSFYNAKLPLKDASGRTIGILVMEIPFTSVAGQQGAIEKAEGIQRELAPQIPNYQWLFQ